MAAKLNFVKTIKVKAIQYTGDNIKDVIAFDKFYINIGPEGKYGIWHGRFHELQVGEWVIEEDCKHPYTLSDEDFKKEYKPAKKR